MTFDNIGSCFYEMEKMRLMSPLAIVHYSWCWDSKLSVSTLLCFKNKRYIYEIPTYKTHSLIWHLVWWIKKNPVHCSLLCWPFPMEIIWRVSTSVLPSERKHSLLGMTTITLLAWLRKNFTICLMLAIICFPDELIDSMWFLMLCVNYTFQIAAC